MIQNDLFENVNVKVRVILRQDPCVSYQFIYFYLKIPLQPLHPYLQPAPPLPSPDPFHARRELRLR